LNTDLSKIARELDTDRLHLRPLQPSDAAGMYAMLSDPESMKYWISPPVPKIEDAAKLLQEDLDSDAAGNSLCWAITLRGSDEMIGKCILFHFSHANHRAEIGFILNRKHWRQGLTYEALVAVIAFAFDRLDLHRIEADVDPDNQASLGILDKLGFEREGLFRDRWHLKGQWVDSVMLGLVRSS
jgi:RimJ/RimL family protein N-acetyltransferase